MSDARDRLEALLDERIVVLDGAWGTMLQRAGLEDADYRGERFADRFGIAVRADSGFALWRDLVLCGWQTVRLRPDAPGARRVLGAPNPRAMRDPHGRLEAFQPNDMNLRWGPVRLVNSRPLMPIEDALAICLRHPDAPASAKSSRLTTAHTPVRRRART